MFLCHWETGIKSPETLSTYKYGQHGKRSQDKVTKTYRYIERDFKNEDKGKIGRK